MHYDVIVIGAGHAGIEAAASSARMGCNVCLITADVTAIGRLSCNPSIGGSAKGHLTKEIDALGGIMPRIADVSGLQFKTLNASKGPAVWSPRSQNDKDLYPLFAQQFLRSIPNLTIREASVTGAIVTDDQIRGIVLENGQQISATCVVLCSGTFLNGLMWTGAGSTQGGRVDEKPALHISDLLSDYGIERGRLKTGTPPRISHQSINFSSMEPHNGDENPSAFSIYTSSVKNIIACWATATTEYTHDILRSGFSESPMFTGLIHGAGPRYCPSVEDKVARFSERTSHAIVLEPEGLHTNSVYVNGFSTSLPKQVQQDGLHSIPGLENAEILRYGYAVEYDFFFPYQLTFSLETKNINNLFFAGQINGTSGYEEAASQGLIAGINAALRVLGKAPFTLKRSEAYIGVMIDDLVNKSTEEPYRIFTSLAEYRLLLRTDTAYERLFNYGVEFGLHSPEMVAKQERLQKIKQEITEELRNRKVEPAEVNTYLSEISEDPIPEKITAETLVKRPAVKVKDVLSIIKTKHLQHFLEHEKQIFEVETAIRYHGYVAKQLKDIERFALQEEQEIPKNFSYDSIHSLSQEAREKLKKIQPQSLGQASRIQGVSATDVQVLAVYLK